MTLRVRSKLKEECRAFFKSRGKVSELDALIDRILLDAYLTSHQPKPRKSRARSMKSKARFV